MGVWFLIGLFVCLFVHSQSLATLTYIEKTLSMYQVPIPAASPQSGTGIQFSSSKWVKNKNFCRKYTWKCMTCELDNVCGGFL